MSKQEDIWQSRHYTILKRYMTLVGIWPYQTTWNRYLSSVPMFIFSLSILVPQTLYLVIGPTNIDDLFECLPSIIITVIFSSKLAIIMMNNEKIKTCFKTMEKDWLMLNSDIEKAILQRHAEYGRQMSTFYSVFMLITAFFYLIKPIVLTFLEEEKDISNSTKSSMPGVSRLPFHVEYGEGLHPYIYPITIHCYLAVFAHVFLTIAIDGLYYSLVHHACGMFAIVGHILENIGKDNESVSDLSSNPDKKEDAHYALALYCLRKHIRTINFAESIESMFTGILLISISLNMIAGSLCGIQVIMNLNNAGDIAAPLSIYVAQLTHMFLQFWQAQFLLDYSVVPYESICRGKWYHTSRRCQKILLLMMNRSVMPCRITAGRTLILSIETFGSVLKTSMSYFTVLRSFQ